MDRATVVGWLVEEGASVAVGDDLVDIETEKIANAVQASHAGILRRQVGKTGDTILCGGLIGVIADDSVPEEEIAAFVAEHTQAADGSQAKDTTPSPQLSEVQGHTLRYLIQGTQSEGGVPVLLIHGFGGDLNNWLFVQPSLAGSRTTYAVDLPGHGGSSKDLEGIESLTDVADLLLAFLDKLRLDRVNLVAHSMGAAIALALATRYPGRMASLVLLSPVGLGPPPARPFIEGLITAKNRQQMGVVLKMLMADESLVSRDMINDILKYTRIDGVDAALRKFAGFLPHENRAMTGLLPGVKVPVHILWGEKDRIVPVSPASELIEKALSP
jgi:pyruvate dehydrogenase E2 component (dihydrolipoamide acetyltransferase)